MSTHHVVYGFTGLSPSGFSLASHSMLCLHMVGVILCIKNGRSRFSEWTGTSEDHRPFPGAPHCEMRRKTRIPAGKESPSSRAREKRQVVLLPVGRLLSCSKCEARPEDSLEKSLGEIGLISPGPLPWIPASAAGVSAATGDLRDRSGWPQGCPHARLEASNSSR